MLGIDIQQILLHLFNFGILFAGLYFILYNPVKKFMDGRVEHYKELEASAQTKLSEAESLRIERQSGLDNLKDEISAMRAEAEQEMSDYRDSQTQAAKAEAEKIISDARENAAKERDRIVEQSSAELTDLAVQAAKKVMEESVSDSYDRFLDAAEKEL